MELVGRGTLLLAVAMATNGQTARERIAQLREFEKTLGWLPPPSLARSSPREAYYRCYYTGKLELPDSYEGLKLRQGQAAGCGLDVTQYDVFFYRIETVASEDAPLTPALEQASAERLAVVVLHEDFHQQEQIRKLPDPVAEAASTLAGFAAAARFARERLGEESELYRRLAREPELFLEKARLVNQWHSRLRQLYDAAARGAMTREQALVAKAQAFAELEQRCQAIEPEPASFNRCLPVNNNAGLAFDFTYTRYYPLLYELWEALDRDISRFTAALGEARQQRLASHEAIQRYFERSIREARRQRRAGSPAVPR